MTAAVVIPAYNGHHFLKANLPAVLAMKPTEVIIVDDASADGTVDFIRQTYPQVKLLVNARNSRFPLTVNRGVAAATGDLIILLNQDVTPRPDLITSALPHFKDSKVFAVTFNEQGRSWAQGGWKSGFLEFTNGVLDHSVHQSLWPSGGSSAIRRSLWNRLGGLDPVFTPGYYEDLDLGLRASAAGFRIIWDPRCKVTHLTETSFPREFAPKTLRYIKERNYLLVNWKHLPEGQLVAHISGLIRRLVAGPGYVVPLLLALWRAPRLIWPK